MRFFTLLAFAFFQVARADALSLDEFIGRIEAAPSVAYVRHVSDIPQGVRAVAAQVISEEPLAMADTGAPWNDTDTVEDMSLPFRRLVWCVSTDDSYLLHYEKGGVGYGVHYLLISAPNADGARELVWSAVGSKPAQDVEQFIDHLGSRKIRSIPGVRH